VQASQRKIPILIDAERKREGLDELLNFASYVVCSAKFPQVSCPIANYSKSYPRLFQLSMTIAFFFVKTLLLSHIPCIKAKCLCFFLMTETGCCFCFLLFMILGPVMFFQECKSALFFFCLYVTPFIKRDPSRCIFQTPNLRKLGVSMTFLCCWYLVDYFIFSKSKFAGLD
jgi:hypothetical protein